MEKPRRNRISATVEEIKDFDPDLHVLLSEKGFGVGNSLGPPGEYF